MDKNPFAPFWEKNEPDFINDEGVKWWLDKDLTKYANRASLDYQAFIVMKPDGYTTRLVLDELRKPIYDSQKLEDVAFFIDKQKLIRKK